MVGIECDAAAFYHHFKKVHTRNCSLKKIFLSKFCKQGGEKDYSRYSQVSLLTLCYHWQTLSNSFLVELVIAKDHYFSLQFFTFLK